MPSENEKHFKVPFLLVLELNAVLFKNTSQHATLFMTTERKTSSSEVVAGNTRVQIHRK